MRPLRLATIVGIALVVACRAPERSVPKAIQIAITTAPSSLDPQQATTTVCCDIARQQFEGLMGLDEQSRPTGALSDRWVIAADGKSVRFHLRQAKFSDGSDVRPSDVAASFERACAPSTASSEAELFLGDIVGVRERLANKSARIEGIEVDDAKAEVTLRLSHRSPAFLTKLAHPIASIVAIRSGKLLGTGGYMLDAVQDGVRYSLLPNRFAMNPAQNDGIDFLVVADTATRLNLFREGRLDICPVGLGDSDSVRNEARMRPHIRHVPMASVAFVQFNAKTEPALSDVHTRRALAMATDRHRIADLILNGRSSYANSLLPSSIPGATDAEDVPIGDPYAAGQEWELSNHHPERLTLYYGDKDRLQSVAESIVSGWRQHLGLDAKASFLASGALLAKNEKGEIAAYLTGWSGDYPDPENFVKAILDSRSATNKSGYGNASVDRLIDEAEATTDANLRATKYAEAVRIALAEAPIVPLFHQVEMELVSSRVNGFQALGPFGRPALSHIKFRQ